MKKLMKIESAKVDLNPNAKLSPEEMQNLTGGAGCVCYKNPFMIGNPDFPNSSVCACWNNPFGFCTNVNGGGSPSSFVNEYHTLNP